jgi:nucleoside 2-deoxyribosyltransferase
MTTIYFAAPLFTMAERMFNESLAKELETLGYKVNLPQKFCEGIEQEYLIFTQCIIHIHKSDVVVAILDGSDVDSGTAVEIGYAGGKNIPIVGVRTDFRTSSDGSNGVNVMCDYMCSALVMYDSDIKSIAVKIDDILRTDFSCNLEKL